MQLGSKFQQLSVLKAAQVAHRKQPQYGKYLAVAQAHTKRLDATVADLEERADTTQKQKADGEAFRGERRSATPPQACVSLCGLRKADHASSVVILDNNEAPEAAPLVPMQLNPDTVACTAYINNCSHTQVLSSFLQFMSPTLYLPGLPTSCLLLSQSAS